MNLYLLAIYIFEPILSLNWIISYILGWVTNLYQQWPKVTCKITVTHVFPDRLLSDWLIHLPQEPLLFMSKVRYVYRTDVASLHRKQLVNLIHITLESMV